MRCFKGALVVAMAVSLLVVATSPALANGVYVMKIEVPANNDEWLEVPHIDMKSGDILVVQARGKVQVHVGVTGTYHCGPFGGVGSLPKSELHVKVGSEATAMPGYDYVARGQGKVKLKFMDENYSDNQGSFDVYLVYVPGGYVSDLGTVQPANQ